MDHVTAGQEWIKCGGMPVAVDAAGFVVLGDVSPVDSDLGELDLLASAWAEAMAAHAAGLVIGDQDDEALTAAAFEARRRDTARLAELEFSLVVAV